MQGKTNLYGFAEETLDSLMLTLLPPIGHEYKRIPVPLKQNEEDVDIKVFILKCLLDALQENAGFQIPKVRTSWSSSGMIFWASVAAVYLICFLNHITLNIYAESLSAFT